MPTTPCAAGAAPGSPALVAVRCEALPLPQPLRMPADSAPASASAAISRSVDARMARTLAGAPERASPLRGAAGGSLRRYAGGAHAAPRRDAGRVDRQACRARSFAQGLGPAPVGIWREDCARLQATMHIGAQMMQASLHSASLPRQERTSRVPDPMSETGGPKLCWG